MSRQPILLYAEDERLLGELPQQLRLDGYDPHCARAREQCLWALAERRPAALLVGEVPTLPDTLALLRELRACEGGVDPDVPVLVLGSGQDALCQVAAFDAGADDVQPADVSYLVLRARLRALIMRSELARRPRQVEVRSLRIDTDLREARYAGRPIELTSIEFSLLAQLASRPGRLFTKRELQRDVWGSAVGAGPHSRALDAHLSRLRRKLAAAGAQGAIENRRGTGYRLGLVEPDAAAAA